tara:strand:+ start:253 stop:1128 length:876 start_codon:yes stop_codon:yes gene_type:complete
MSNPKRLIKKFDFKNAMLNGAKPHVALVDNGANLIEVLSLKQAKEVTVDMSMRTFLERFFHLYSDDAERLASLLGYDIEEYEGFDNQEYIENTINSRIGTVTLLKGKEVPEKLPASMVDIIKGLQEKIGDKLKTSEDSTSEDIKKSLEGESNMNEKEIQALKQELEDSQKAADSLKAKVKELDSLKSQLEDLKKAQEDKKLEETVELIKSFNIFEGEDTVKSVAQFVTDNREVPAMGDILKSLESARIVKESFGEEEHGSDVTSNDEIDSNKSFDAVSDEVTNILKSRKSK